VHRHLGLDGDALDPPFDRGIEVFRRDDLVHQPQRSGSLRIEPVAMR
jgi:hypothetical protein